MAVEVSTEKTKTVEKRLWTAATGLSLWLLLLLIGWVGGGAVHLLLLAVVVIFPWSAARTANSRDQGLVSEGESSVSADSGEVEDSSSSSPNSHEGSAL